MKKIALITRNKLFAESLIFAIKKSDALIRLEMYMTLDIRQAVLDSEVLQADIALVDYTSYERTECLSLCEDLHKNLAKIALLISQDEPARYEVLREAKERGIIEDFIFYEASLQYFIAKLLSL